MALTASPARSGESITRLTPQEHSRLVVAGAWRLWGFWGPGWCVPWAGLGSWGRAGVWPVPVPAGSLSPPSFAESAPGKDFPAGATRDSPHLKGEATVVEGGCQPKGRAQVTITDCVLSLLGLPTFSARPEGQEEGRMSEFPAAEPTPAPGRRPPPWVLAQAKSRARKDRVRGPSRVAEASRPSSRASTAALLCPMHRPSGLGQGRGCASGIACCLVRGPV